tara:strand:+ start:616 stop:804 length:189 start_codon:yes stop_codon:yes gene_type:complete
MVDSDVVMGAGDCNVGQYHSTPLLVKIATPTDLFGFATIFISDGTTMPEEECAGKDSVVTLL